MIKREITHHSDILCGTSSIYGVKTSHVEDDINCAKCIRSMDKIKFEQELREYEGEESEELR